jgi:hypothetical protein
LDSEQKGFDFKKNCGSIADIFYFIKQGNKMLTNEESSLFGKITCLLLDKRYEEKERLTTQFSAQNLKINFFVVGNGNILPSNVYDYIDIVPPPNRTGYPAWANRPNSYNAFCSYKIILQQALDEGWQSATLVEDDCTLRPNFSEIVPQAIKELEQVPRWDMMYWCSCHAWTSTYLFQPHLLKLNGSGGFQCVTIRRSLFKTFIDMPMTAPIDALAGKLHSQYNCYAVWPNVAIPKPGFSYCEGTYYDNTKLYEIRGC